MNIDHIAIYATESAHGPMALDSDYRRRWWLPVLGPTATLMLDRFAELEPDIWHVLDTAELATGLGLGNGRGRNSPVIRSLDRCIRFGFGRYEIDLNHPTSDPCATIWTATTIVPGHHIERWTPRMQADHNAELARLAERAA